LLTVLSPAADHSTTCRFCGDQRVVRPYRRLAVGLPQAGGDPTESAGGGGVERQGTERRLGELQVGPTNGAFALVIGDEWTDRQFGEGEGDLRMPRAA
jgi:hypothetical protein